MGIVKLVNAGLDQSDFGVILRGGLHMSFIENILTDDYQREILPGTSAQRLVRAFKDPESKVPDVVLGMRGIHTSDKDGVWTLKDEVYVIDGLQRISAAIQILGEGGEPRLGAVVHFNTTKLWEIEQFRKLNADRIRVAPSVLLRNQGDNYEVVATLQRLCEQSSDFALKGRVCWQQRPRKNHLLNAVVLLRTCGALHSYYPGGLATGIQDMVEGCQRIFDTIGKITFRKNVRTFFELVEECWGLSTIQNPSGATQIKAPFLTTLGRVFADHSDFWRGDELLVVAPLKKKLKLFKLLDPVVQQLAGSHGPSLQLLYSLFVEHINAGKRTRRLTQRTRPAKSGRKEVSETDAA